MFLSDMQVIFMLLSPLFSNLWLVNPVGFVMMFTFFLNLLKCKLAH